MASKQALAHLEQVRKYQAELVGSTNVAPTLEEMRSGSEAILETTGTMPEGVTIEQVDVDGLSALWLKPIKALDDSVLLYFHGGGYVLQSANSHRKLASHLAVQSRRNVLSINYRLAPEHPHPAAVNDALIAYQWLLNKNFSASKIGIAGDSAGGGLTVALLLFVKQKGLAQPGGAVVFSPWVDLEGIGESMDSKATVDLMVNREVMGMMANMFLNGASPRDPLAAPMYGNFAGVAPLYIQVGGDETLLDDSIRLASRAAHDGVPVHLQVFPEMQHVFQASIGVVPEADAAVAEAGEWFKKVLS